MIAALALAASLESFPSYERVIALEARGERTLVTTGGGSYYLEPDGTYTLTRDSAPASGTPPAVVDAVPGLVSARLGDLLATDRGLFRASSGTLTRLGPPGLPDENVNALAVGAGALWVGHFDRGLSRLKDGVWRRWGAEDGLPSEWIDDLAVDGPRLWGATEKGAFVVVGDSVTLVDREPTAAVFASSGSAWLAQPGRVVVLRPDGTRESFSTPERHPQRIRVEGGTIWLAGLDGLYELARGKIARHGVLDGALPADWITALAPWEGGLLVGTYDAGLAALGEAPPLPGAWINVGALVSRPGLIAAGGREEGLHLFRRGRWVRLGRAEGLPGEDVSAVAFDGDWLWVGTRSGLARLRL